MSEKSEPRMVRHDTLEPDAPSPWDPEKRAEFIAELKRDIPIRAGMTIDQVRAYIEENAKRVSDIESKRKDKFAVPMFANPELHLYVFVGTTSKTKERSLTYWVNGRHQFWMDMAVQNEKVKNIYIRPGNMNIIGPAFLYDGAGEHSQGVDADKQKDP
jgi:hypothetical protein